MPVLDAALGIKREADIGNIMSMNYYHVNEAGIGAGSPRQKPNRHLLKIISVLIGWPILNKTSLHLKPMESDIMYCIDLYLRPVKGNSYQDLVHQLNFIGL